MQKRMISIVLCLVMVSTVTVTGAVSAAPAKPDSTTPSEVKYAVYDRAGGLVIGSITIDLTTGQFNFMGKVTPRGFPLSDYKLLLEIQPTKVYEWLTVRQPVSKTTETGSVHINGRIEPGMLQDIRTQSSAGNYGSTWWIVYRYWP